MKLARLNPDLVNWETEFVPTGGSSAVMKLAFDPTDGMPSIAHTNGVQTEDSKEYYGQFAHKTLEYGWTFVHLFDSHPIGIIYDTDPNSLAHGTAYIGSYFSHGFDSVIECIRIRDGNVMTDYAKLNNYWWNAVALALSPSGETSLAYAWQVPTTDQRNRIPEIAVSVRAPYSD